jgi:hypothetical protein
MKMRSSQRSKVMIVGAIIGALTGIGAAYVLLQRAEKNDSEMSLTTGEGLRLGFIILGLLRSIAQISDDD